MVDLGNLFKDLVFDNLVKAGVNRVLSRIPKLIAVPIFGPILGGLISLVITKVADILFEMLDEYVDFKQIAFKDKQLEKTYNTAATKLKILAHEKGIDSPEFKEQRNVDKNALADFVSLRDIAKS